MSNVFKCRCRGCQDLSIKNLEFSASPVVVVMAPSEYRVEKFRGKEQPLHALPISEMCLVKKVSRLPSTSTRSTPLRITFFLAASTTQNKNDSLHLHYGCRWNAFRKKFFDREAKWMFHETKKLTNIPVCSNIPWSNKQRHSLSSLNAYLEGST